ncbi:type 1 fimbrial protein [Enterobacter hormaechei]|nr:type 1 fimbrial protein [Enterobacter hormaechei]
MKKQIAKMTVLGALVLCGISAANAADGTIHFTGSVNAGSCNINVPDGGNVDLGSIRKREIAAGASGAKLGTPATFNIELSDCDPGKTNAAITFGETTDADADNGDAFKLTPGSVAKGVGVTIWDANNAILKPGVVAANSQTFQDTVGGMLTYQASYMVTKPSAAQDGTANADIDFRITYP